MPAEALRIAHQPSLTDATLLLGFTGWMDGGEASTGTIEWLGHLLGAEPFASIDPEPFYILNFPGDMQTSALFRPHTRIEDGIIEELEMPESVFHVAAGQNLVLFSGKEPNVGWQSFADCVFELCEKSGVKWIYFLGSVGGAAPHTRDPRTHASVSNPAMKERLTSLGVRFSEYEGPASFVTYLTTRAESHGIGMANLVAELPGYLEGRNPKGIEAMVRKLANLLKLSIDLHELRQASDDWEKRVNEAVATRPDLSKHIQELEEQFDNETFDSELGHVRDWLEERGIRVD